MATVAAGALVLACVGGIVSLTAAPDSPAIIPPTNGAEPSYTTPRVGTLRVPAIGLDVAVVTGVSDAAIRHQPGHDPASATIGVPGTALIRGHRTVFGNPFLCLDVLEPGDVIETITERGRLHFAVTGTEIVASDAELPSSDHVLVVLEANHPMYSDRELIRVTAELTEPPYTELPAFAPDQSCD